MYREENEVVWRVIYAFESISPMTSLKENLCGRLVTAYSIKTSLHQRIIVISRMVRTGESSDALGRLRGSGSIVNTDP